MKRKGKKTKRTFDLDFTVTQEEYIPTNSNWKDLSQDLNPDKFNTAPVEVLHNERVFTVRVHGFHIPKDKKAKSIVFFSDDKGKLWAFRF